MAKIYKNQSNLRITAATGVNLTGALSLKIAYIKPSKSTGSWTATTLSATGGTMYVDMSTGQYMDESGFWHLYALVTFSDGRSAPGTGHREYVYNPGQ